MKREISLNLSLRMIDFLNWIKSNFSFFFCLIVHFDPERLRHKPVLLRLLLVEMSKKKIFDASSDIFIVVRGLSVSLFSIGHIQLDVSNSQSENETREIWGYSESSKKSCLNVRQSLLLGIFRRTFIFYLFFKRWIKDFGRRIFTCSTGPTTIALGGWRGSRNRSWYSFNFGFIRFLTQSLVRSLKVLKQDDISFVIHIPLTLSLPSFWSDLVYF